LEIINPEEEHTRSVPLQYNWCGTRLYALVIRFEQYGFEDSGQVAHEGWKEIYD
jgi:hypothetical protein